MQVYDYKTDTVSEVDSTFTPEEGEEVNGVFYPVYECSCVFERHGTTVITGHEEVVVVLPDGNVIYCRTR